MKQKRKFRVTILFLVDVALYDVDASQFRRSRTEKSFCSSFLRSDNQMKLAQCDGALTLADQRDPDLCTDLD